MKLFLQYVPVLVFLAFLFGCQQQQQTFSEVDKESFENEVKEQFSQLIAAINRKTAEGWSQYYSSEDFISAVAGANYYTVRSEWIDFITDHFSTRERQLVEPLQVNVTALAPNLALMTSDESSEIWLKDGSHFKFKHVFTMIWKKEQDVWKILHSHESWTD